MKMKYILPILCLLFTFVSCQEDNTPPPPNPNPNYTEVGPSMEFVHPGILHDSFHYPNAELCEWECFSSGGLLQTVAAEFFGLCFIYNSRSFHNYCSF